MAGKTNTFNYSNVNSEIKSHSSVLFNERVHVKLYILETEFMEVKAKPTLKGVIHIKSVLSQLWKDIRTLIFYDPKCRKHLNLETDTPGVYTIDLIFKKIDQYCEFLINNPELINYSYLQMIINDLDIIERNIRNILQFFKYFIRFDKPQKPDIDDAIDRYKNMADKNTMKELESVLGDKALFNKESTNDDDELDDDFFDELEESDEEDGKQN